jgi:hypothetical protein
MIADYYYVVPGYAGASCATGQQSQTTETNAKLAIVKAVNAMVAN